MLVAISLVLVASVTAHGPNCCSKVSGSCRSACEKLHHDTISDVETKEQRLLDVRNFCPHHLVAFWKCMNQSEEEFGDERIWAACCEEAQTEKCRWGCKNAIRTSELQLHCRRSDELALYSCVDKQETGDECCGLARSPDCHDLCRRWLQEPGKVSWAVITSSCTSTVQNCLNNISKPFLLTNPQKYLHCCDHASTSTCRDACQKNLKKRVYDIEIMNNLKDACGPLVLHEGEMKLAQCLLHSEPAALTVSDSLGNDGAILHCCYKAVNNTCKRSCIRTFSNFSNSYEEYVKNCQTSTEEDLLQCYDEVAEPCELGCDGLSYCSEFNKRPLDLFRACNSEADRAAQKDIADIKETGHIKLLDKQKLFIKDLIHCPPERFKTLACINQIKPCERTSQTTRICFDQCMELMEECIDVKKPQAMEYAMAICKLLAPSSPKNKCINVTIPDSGQEEKNGELTNPCRNGAAICGINEICKVNKSCVSSQQCNMYTCTKGCLIGKTQNILVPERSYARVPKPGKGICHKICQCSRTGVMKHCRETCRLPGLGNTSCKKRVHGSTWYISCNMCSCYYGETVCSKRSCEVNSSNETSVSSNSHQCSCGPHYLPVCAWNGVTYPNECIARCFVGGFTDGPCSDHKLCNNTICQRREDKCLPKPQVCLPFLHNNCSQHICVSKRSDCSMYSEDPVCDTEGNTHANPCRLLKANKELSYFGPCLANCKSEGEVCGVDGNTYNSECAAHARYISVDYEGPCTALGTITEFPGYQCPDVKCPKLPEMCDAVTPPGACCPTCAGAITILFSQKEIDRVLLDMNGEGIEQFSVEAIMATLEREVMTAECSLRGHLTIEYTLMVLITPSRKDANSLVYEACVREAEKIEMLIKRQSPRIVVPLSTSIFTGARLAHKSAELDPDSTSLLIPVPLLISLFVLCNLFSYYF